MRNFEPLVTRPVGGASVGGSCDACWRSRPGGNWSRRALRQGCYWWSGSTTHPAETALKVDPSGPWKDKKIWSWSAACLAGRKQPGQVGARLFTRLLLSPIQYLNRKGGI